jgi:hypothetical protein
MVAPFTSRMMQYAHTHLCADATGLAVMNRTNHVKTSKTKSSMYVIEGFRRCRNVVLSLLGLYPASFLGKKLTFRDYVAVPSSGFRSPREPEDGTDK